MPAWLARVIGALIAANATAHCCCGPHDADHDCGCRDCPASRGSDDDAAPSSERGIKSCGTTGERPTLPAPPVFVLPAPAVVVDRPARSLDPPLPVATPSSRTPSVPCPDG